MEVSEAFHVSNKGVMDNAGIPDGSHKAPKGLRHAEPETTSIYLDAVGAEEREIAARMWN